MCICVDTHIKNTLYIDTNIYIATYIHIYKHMYIYIIYIYIVNHLQNRKKQNPQPQPERTKALNPNPKKAKPHTVHWDWRFRCAIYICTRWGFKAFENISKQDPLTPNKGKYKMSQSPT